MNYKALYTVSYLSDLFCFNIYNNVYIFKLSEKIQNEVISEVILEYIQYYIEKGGYNNFDLNQPIVSSTLLSVVSLNILMLKRITDAFNKYRDKESKLLHEIKKSIKEVYEIVKDKPLEQKNPILLGGDLTTSEESFEELRVDEKYTGNKNTNYHSDICVRVIPVGLYFGAENELEKLIDLAIKISKLTNNNTIGILAGITAAYFVSLATREISISKWVFLLVDLLESDIIKRQIELDDTENMIQYVKFLGYWRFYRDSKFDGGKINRTRSDNSLVFKWKNYGSYVYGDMAPFEDAVSCLVISYDSLLECEGSFEKIIYYAFFLPGDIMSIGGYVGALYGLIYGTDDLPHNMLKYLDKVEGFDKFLNSIKL